jgi:hypothetical protein
MEAEAGKSQTGGAGDGALQKVSAGKILHRFSPFSYVSLRFRNAF